MTPENRERLKTLLRAIGDEHDALHLINPALDRHGNETQYNVASMIIAMANVEHFLRTGSAKTEDERRGFGLILECCAQALLVNVVRDEIARESTLHKPRAIGGAR